MGDSQSRTAEGLAKAWGEGCLFMSNTLGSAQRVEVRQRVGKAAQRQHRQHRRRARASTRRFRALELPRKDVPAVGDVRGSSTRQNVNKHTFAVS